MGSLEGKAVIISGGSKGMGRHFIDTLVGAGAKVACLARASAELDALASTYSDNVLTIPCDVSVSEQVNEAVAKTVATFGRLDAVVNNAAIFHPFMLETARDDQIHNHINLNILGVIWLSRAAIPHLRKTEGQIINISSEAVRHPFPMLSIYAATKAAVETLSTALRDELQSENIRVSILRSGSVSGSTGALSWPEGAGEAFLKKISQTGHAAMSGLPATPESMAKALLAIMTLPKDVNADLIEVRAAREGVPEGARKNPD